MKRFLMGTIIIITLCLFLVSFAGTASSCPDEHCKCCTKDNKYVGKVTNTMCWKWWPPGCDYCGGSKQDVKNCNKKYKECNNKCHICKGAFGEECTF
jgi:thioredoxin-related protein